MRGVANLSVPAELKQRIEQLAREHEQNPSTLIASALDLLVEAEARQVWEVRRRLASRTGKTVSNERVLAWLSTWDLNGEVPAPKCE